MYISLNKNKNGAAVLFAVMYPAYFLCSAVNVKALTLNPELLLCMACVCPVFCTKKVSAVYALIFGFLTDISITPPAHFSPVLFLICALAIPKLISFFSGINAAVCVVCSMPLLLVRSLAGLAYLMSLHEGVSAMQFVKNTLLPEFVLNAACVILTYFVCAGLAKLFRIK